MTQGPLVLAVSNRKGGSGKTTTAVNLAAEWAVRGHRVLLIDLDTQGHAAAGVGVPPDDGPTVHRLFREAGFRLAEALRPTALDNLTFVPADQTFENVDVAREPGRLRQQIQALGERFDRVVLDTPPGLDIALLNALAAAHGVLVPLIPHHLSAEGVRQLARVFYRIAARDNPELKLVGLLPVTVERRINLHRTVLADLAAQYGDKRVLRGIRSDIRIAEAFATGRPVRAFAPKSRGALDYRLLADELEALWIGTESSQQRPARP